jgi:NADPH:quinone reductase-like Zn-dependent oxidoreductase
VGSTAIAILAALGYHVTAISGRESNTEYLKALGAKEVLSRDGYLEAPRPLENATVGRGGRYRWRHAAGASTVADEL